MLALMLKIAVNINITCDLALKPLANIPQYFWQ